MKKLFIYSFLLVVGISFLSGCNDAGPLVILVRHAEKVDQSVDPELSKEGEKRAAQLASTLRDIDVSHLFCTHLKRTQQTLAPLEKAFAKKCQVLDAKDVVGLAEELRKLDAKDIAVVAGHSNTLGLIAVSLGASEKELFYVDHDDYDGLFFLETTRKGISRFTKLHVGPRNPTTTTTTTTNAP
ncbi:MAG: histidine phosphatase family protein [Deltaproteobacteria bacterium]|nr:histidine phosphatase family protein [Deltaproteobacteria bacterium]